MNFLIIALKRVLNTEEYDKANCEYKFSILLIILHSVLFYFSKFYISVQFLFEITYCKSSSKPPQGAYSFQGHLRWEGGHFGNLEKAMASDQFSIKN